MSEILIGPSFLVDWKAAETAAVDHMRTLGFIDAQATGPGTDGGIDALSSDAAAQVKFYASPVGRPDIQRLRGAAHEYRLALFYSTGGYTMEAVAYANDAGVALFLMDPYGHCEPTSELAALLVEPEYVEERKQRLEELQAHRYRFAASAFESDLDLYAKFARTLPMNPEESALYSYVLSGLELAVRDFRDAIESKQFGHADSTFGEIQKRIAFLTWITGPEPKIYSELEDAISDGWQRDATPGSDHLLQRVATGVEDLKKFLSDSLGGWYETFPDDIQPDELVDYEAVRFAGMLLVISIDPSLLSSDLLQQLKASVRTAVQRSHRAATRVFEHILNRHLELGLEQPRGLIADQLRADSMTARILRQSDASDR